MRFRPIIAILCSILSSVLKHTPVEAKPVSMEGAVLHVRLGLYFGGKQDSRGYRLFGK